MTQKEFTRKSITILFLAAILIGCMIWEVAVSRKSSREPATANAKTTTSATGSALSGVRGVWISFGDYKNAGLYNKSRNQFVTNADKYFKKLKADGINTVYFHVVPCNDAIYPSKYLDWSSYMYEHAPDYDALKILVSTAHKYQMSFHAWINPYRKKMGVIYNPGKASSTNRILRIVKEIIRNYDVDGIHFDDYFYPSRARGAQFYKVSISKRKKIINRMVKKVYKTVKKMDKKLLFGISPAGNIEYAESLGCDLKSWLNQKGYIDYIVPQIYWSDQYMVNGKNVNMYTDRLNDWLDINKKNTPMFIGLALYRAGSHSSPDMGWSRKNNNIVTQIRQLKRKGCQGYVLFSSAYLYNSTTRKEVKNYRSYIRS